MLVEHIMAAERWPDVKPLLLLSLVVLTTLVGTTRAVSADTDVVGKWIVVYAGSPGTAPKTVGSMILDLKVNGNVVTGTAFIGAWPGEAPISDGKIESDHITFTATGHVGSTTGIPTCKFDVIMQDDEMHVTLTAIKNAGGPLPYGHAFSYTGKRKRD